MPRISKIELSPDNGCIIDMKWSLGPLSYHSSGAGKVAVEPTKEIIRLPEIVLYDHIGFKGSYARTNLSFHYVGDYWNDRMSCLIVSLMEYLAVAAAVALVLPGSLFLIPSKRRLAIRLSLGVGALFAGLAVLTLGYYGVLFLALGRSPDFLDIDSCLDAGGMWNYATRTCEHSR